MLYKIDCLATLKEKKNVCIFCTTFPTGSKYGVDGELRISGIECQTDVMMVSKHTILHLSKRKHVISNPFVLVHKTCEM